MTIGLPGLAETLVAVAEPDTLKVPVRFTAMLTEPLFRSSQVSGVGVQVTIKSCCVLIFVVFTRLQPLLSVMVTEMEPAESPVALVVLEPPRDQL